VKAIEAEAGEIAFASPASTSIDELVQLRSAARVLSRKQARRSSAPMAGTASSRRFGRGLDFAEVREYQPGDDVRQIDWNVTARTGRAHTKLFVEERETPVFLVVDFRASMRFGTRGMYKSVLAARLAALLGWSAVNGRDRVGGLTFTDDWHSEVRPDAGRRGLMSLFRAIVQGQKHVPGRDTGQFVDSLARLRQVAQAGSTIIILSDFKGFDEKAKTALGGLRESLQLIAVQVVDPLERQAPPIGQYSMVDAKDALRARLGISIASEKGRDEYANRFDEHCRQVGDCFAHGRHRHRIVVTDQPLLASAQRILSTGA